VYDNDAEAAAKAEAAKAEAAKAEAEAKAKADAEAKAAAPTGKVFTQVEVNSILAENKRKLREQNETLVTELETLRSSKNLSQQEIDSLNQRIEGLQNQYMSDKEKAERERKRLLDEHKTAITSTSAERDTWKNRYTGERIQRDLTAAALEAEAFNASQIVDLLIGKAALSEEVGEDGKSTGNLLTTVKITVPDEKGVPKEVVLSPSQAVTKMREMTERYGNLFKSKASGGTGGNNTGGSTGGTLDVAKLAKDPKAWREHRKELKEKGLI
jgi:chaperonin cofactor prefoldin